MHIRHEVVGDAHGVLADLACRQHISHVTATSPSTATVTACLWGPDCCACHVCHRAWWQLCPERPPDGWAPTGLKYRRSTMRQSFSAANRSRSMSSMMSFERPYGLSACQPDYSGTETRSGGIPWGSLLHVVPCLHQLPCQCGTSCSCGSIVSATAEALLPAISCVSVCRTAVSPAAGASRPAACTPGRHTPSRCC